MANKILQINLQNDITPQVGTYDNTGSVTPSYNSDSGVYSLKPAGTTPYYWFTPTAEVTDFDLCWEDYQDNSQTSPQYRFTIGDSAGNNVLLSYRQHGNFYFGAVNIGELAYQTWHKILIQVRKASATTSKITAYVNGRKVAEGTESALITSAKIALLGKVPNSYYNQNAGQKIRYVTIYDRSYSSKGVNLDGIMTTITGFVSKIKNALSAVAFSGSYTDLSNKPTIPTVNNGTLTIQKNGTDVTTFTANASSNVTANITVPTKVSDLTNDSGFITSDSTKIPLTGTNALAGSIVPSTDSSYDLGSNDKKFYSIYCTMVKTTNISNFNASSYTALCGGTSWTSGASIALSDSSRSVNAGYIQLISRSSTTKEMKLQPDGTWTWQGTACVVSSDRRIKDEINSIPDDLLTAWENLEPKQYKLKSDLETDKENAQIHYGWIAQDVESIIKGDRKAEVKNGLWLHESWEEQQEVSHEEEYQEEVQTKSGETETVTKTRKVIDTPYKAKGDSYGLRYTECLVVECAYLRKKLKELTTRIEELKKGKEATK